MEPLNHHWPCNFFYSRVHVIKQRWQVCQLTIVLEWLVRYSSFDTVTGCVSYLYHFNLTSTRVITFKCEQLTVGGDINLLWQLCYVDLEAVLNIIQDLRVILVWHKGDGQAFGPKSSSTGDLGNNNTMSPNRLLKDQMLACQLSVACRHLLKRIN